MRAEPGLRLTIVAREAHTPYSGMLPGYIAGQYEWDEIHIDLLKLSTAASCRFISDEIIGLDPIQREISFRERPPLRYDVVSINTGGVPGVQTPGIEYTIPVKPIGRFIPQWQRLVERAKTYKDFRLAIVGGGPGSVELCFSITERFPNLFSIDLITATETVLAQHSKGAQKRTVKALAGRVTLRTNEEISEVCKIDESTIARTKDGVEREYDGILWVTGISAPNWLKKSNLPLDPNGFMYVDSFLQSPAYESVFGAGDVVALKNKPRPKSGVYAVREGPVLSHNIRAFGTGRRLKRFKPQSQALALLRLGQHRVLATRRFYLGTNRLAYVWKEWIDVRFMKKFLELPEMPETKQGYTTEQLKENAIDPMRCGGCGAKLGASSLDRVLTRLEIKTDPKVLTKARDDAAIVQVPSDRVVLTIDGFRAMISDPWMFGRISAHHALNDLYAMNSEPKTALALVTVPLMSDELMEEDLFQVMAGSLSVFGETGVSLVGGHSAEGMELSVGFALSGVLNQDPWLKSGMRVGDSLVLTKPLGTGVLLAGAMQRKVPARVYAEVLEEMDRSNANAVRIFSEFDTSACTDITGFGLLGHLSEMCRASEMSASLDLTAIPTLSSADVHLESGIQSSLQENNEQALTDWKIPEEASFGLIKLLVDPQTSGGLLASVNSRDAVECVEALHSAGYQSATIVGSVRDENTPLQIFA